MMHAATPRYDTERVGLVFRAVLLLLFFLPSRLSVDSANKKDSGTGTGTVVALHSSSDALREGSPQQQRHAEGDVVALGSSSTKQQSFRLLELIEQLGVAHHSRFGTLLLLPSGSSSSSSSSTSSSRLQIPALPQPHALNEIVLLGTVRKNLNDACVRGEAFCVDDHIFHGGHGEVWRGHAIAQDGTLDSTVSLVLKRMFVINPEGANREIYFGKLLLKHSHQFTTLITHFDDITEKGPTSFWLVFKDEGVSLSRLLYALTAADGVSAIYEPSMLWRRLRLTLRGTETMRGIMHQLIAAVANLHSLGIAHRDLKPSNLLLNSENGGETRLVVGDFSSAIDAFSLQNLYTLGPPSEKELSMHYAPPEFSLRGHQFNDSAGMLTDYMRYDAWSVGVILLELILGTDDVFSVDQRTAAVIEHKLESEMKARKRGKPSNTEAYEIALHDSLLLAGLADYCIYPLEVGVNRRANGEGQCHGNGRARSFSNAIRKRDPLGIGFDTAEEADRDPISPSKKRRRRGEGNVDNENEVSETERWGLDLLMRFLQMDPAKRITMKDALGHAWFVGPWIGFDGRAWATKEERDSNANAGVVRSLERETSLPHLSLLPLLAIDSEEAETHDIALTLVPDSTTLNANVTATVNVTTDQDLGSEKHGDFVCPKCGRHFHDWSSCHMHMTHRRHLGPSSTSAGVVYHTGCTYSREQAPECMAEHSLLPRDGLSGWCDLVGKRKYMEDSHCLFHSQGYSLYGVFDGHLGSRASKFASKFVGQLFDVNLRESSESEWSDVGDDDGVGDVDRDDEREDMTSMGIAGQEARLRWLNPNLREDDLPTLADSDTVLFSAETVGGNGTNVASISVGKAVLAMQQSFVITSRYINEYSTRSSVGSGTTAALAVVFQSHLLVANAGDTRIILCCTADGAPIVLTVDHTPKVKREMERIERRGGFVVNTGEILRVNGQMAVTRSIGDSLLSAVLTPRPDVMVVSLEPTHVSSHSAPTTPCSELRSKLLVAKLNDSGVGPLLLLLGSDGLFDVMSNGEAVDMVCAHFLKHWVHGWDVPPDDLLHGAAKVLAQEAYVRGSGDNIGVCVVALDLADSSFSYGHTSNAPQ